MFNHISNLLKSSKYSTQNNFKANLKIIDLAVYKFLSSKVPDEIYKERVKKKKTDSVTKMSLNHRKR